MAKSHLTVRDALLALAIVFVWGTNFVVIRLGLDVLPPLFFATLRFCFVFVPAAFFLKRPNVPWANLVIYGVAIGLFQFGMLFIAMKGHISPGLASLVVQMQVFFTIGLAMLRTGEKLAAHRLIAFALALAGMGVIAAHNGQGATLGGVALVLVAAMGWAFGNQASREAGKVNMLAYVVWAAMFSIPPLAILSLALEGPSHLDGGAVAERGQHHVRLCLLGVAAVTLSGRHRGAHVAAGTDLRLRGERVAAGRAPALVEDRRHPADHGGAGGEPAVAAPEARSERRALLGYCRALLTT
jgi:O-acetylserine/cysteine efflux transporter